MRIATRIRIGTRLSLGFGVVIAIAIGMACLGAFKLAGIRGSAQHLTEDRLMKIDRLSQVKDNLNVMARGVRNIVLMPADDASGKRAEQQRIADMRAKNAELMGLLERSVRGGEDRGLLDAVHAALAPYEAAMDKAIRLGVADEDEAATKVLLKELRPVQAAYFKTVDALVAAQQRQMREAVARIQQDAASSSLLMLALATAAAVFGALLAYVIQRSVVQPIRSAVQVARTVAAGDLTSRIEVTTRDETGELLQSMKDMNDALIRLVSRVRESSESIATGSAQIATGAADLSQRTEQQASSLQQTAASMEELTSSVRRNTQTAQQADALAASGVAAARRGGAAVDQMVSTMEEISSSSRRVAEIISVIDGIAFQTNILALNAAVEAARAGEQGQGFAVVAGEVRALAQRSASAAKEIKTLIHSSAERVSAGSQQVGSAGKEMEGLAAEVARVGGLLSEISQSATEQSSGIDQIGHAVNQLDHVTQQNAALVEQSTAAAESLREQAAHLAALVRAFRLGEAAPAA